MGEVKTEFSIMLVVLGVLFRQHFLVPRGTESAQKLGKEVHLGRYS